MASSNTGLLRRQSNTGFARRGGEREEREDWARVAWRTLYASGSRLAEWVHSQQGRALMNGSFGQNISVRASMVGTKQIEGHRQSYFNAFLIQSRGVEQRPACERCIHRGPAPFNCCMRVDGHFGGACASCKYPDKARQCSFWRAPRSGPRTPAAPRPGPALPPPEIIDLDSWTPSPRRLALEGPRTPSRRGAAAAASAGRAAQRTPSRTSASAAGTPTQRTPSEVEVIEVIDLTSSSGRRRVPDVRRFEWPGSASPRRRTTMRQIEDAPRSRTRSPARPSPRPPSPSDLTLAGRLVLSPESHGRITSAPSSGRTPASTPPRLKLEDGDRDTDARSPRTPEGGRASSPEDSDAEPVFISERELTAEERAQWRQRALELLGPAHEEGDEDDRQGAM